MGWFKDLLNAPALIYYREPEKKAEVHNHYYITVDNREITVTKEEFEKYIKKTKHDNKLLR